MSGSSSLGSHSEATRLLCAGTYLDSGFRHSVIDHLVRHKERTVAPSVGIDVVPVLAHALRARQLETETALLLTIVWVGFLVADLVSGESIAGLPMTGVLGYAVLCVLQWGGSNAVYVMDRTTLRSAVPGKRGRTVAVAPAIAWSLAVLYWGLALYGLIVGAGRNWPAAVFPFLIALPVWMHRVRVARVMREELGRARFAARPRAELPPLPYYRRIGAAMDVEQHSRLTIYDPSRPFIGLGSPYQPWSFALELRRSESAAPGGPAPLTSARAIELIRPELEALRASVAATSRDRLRELTIEEFVYLPVGLPRDEIPYDPESVAQHLRDAVDEGGEVRRHFLRIRVGGAEQVVLSVLVRVHTQGGLLVLEVVPHVLNPVRPEYRAVDVIAGRSGSHNVLRSGMEALMTAPAASLAAASSALHTVATAFGGSQFDASSAVADGPVASVRELGSVDSISLFQEMDVSRYTKTIQDRISSGVRNALRSQGYETERFEQQIVQLAAGSVFIGSMSGGAVAAGTGASARQSVGSETK